MRNFAIKTAAKRPEAKSLDPPAGDVDNLFAKVRHLGLRNAGNIAVAQRRPSSAGSEGRISSHDTLNGPGKRRIRSTGRSVFDSSLHESTSNDTADYAVQADHNNWGDEISIQEISDDEVDPLDHPKSYPHIEALMTEGNGRRVNILSPRFEEDVDETKDYAKRRDMFGTASLSVTTQQDEYSPNYHDFAEQHLDVDSLPEIDARNVSLHSNPVQPNETKMRNSGLKLQSFYEDRGEQQDYRLSHQRDVHQEYIERQQKKTLARVMSEIPVAKSAADQMLAVMKHLPTPPLSVPRGVSVPKSVPAHNLEVDVKLRKDDLNDLPEKSSTYTPQEPSRQKHEAINVTFRQDSGDRFRDAASPLDLEDDEYTEAAKKNASGYVRQRSPYREQMPESVTDSKIIAIEQKSGRPKCKTKRRREESKPEALALPDSQDPDHDTIDGEDLDYDREVLFKMRFEDLQKESFDHDPQNVVSVLPKEKVNAPLNEQLEIAAGLENDKRRQFFAALSIEDWEKTGTMLVKNFGDITSHLEGIRQQRRDISTRFEAEVAKKHAAIAKEEANLEQELDNMKDRGKSILETSKTPKKKA